MHSITFSKSIRTCIHIHILKKNLKRNRLSHPDFIQKQIFFNDCFNYMFLTAPSTHRCDLILPSLKTSVMQKLKENSGGRENTAQTSRLIDTHICIVTACLELQSVSSICFEMQLIFTVQIFSAFPTNSTCVIICK